jgi:DNA-binding transcriptional MerR regulator
MNETSSTASPDGKPCRTLDEVSELYGVDPWTIRLWVDRFDIPHTAARNGGMRFSPRAVERIGTILRLAKTGMGLEDARKHLSPRAGNPESN